MKFQSDKNYLQQLWHLSD